MANPGKSDVLGSLAKLPPRKRAAVLGGIIAVIALLYWQFFYSGLKDSEASEKGKRKRLVDERGQLDREMAEFKKLEETHKKLKASIDNISMALPSEAELPSFIDHLQVKAGDAQVNFKSWGRSKEVPVDKYIKVPLKIEVSGTFPQIMHFFYLLGPSASEQREHSEDESVAANAGRIVTIEDLDIGSANIKNDEIILDVAFTAATFRQEEDKSAPAAKPAAGEKKGGVRAAKEKREQDVEARTEGAGDKGAKRLGKPDAPLSPK